MRWNFLICGVAAIFAGSYLDSIRGPLLPVLTREFSLSYAESSWFFIAGNLAAFIANLLLLPLFSRWGEKTVTLWLCLWGLFTTGFAFLTTDYIRLIILAMLVGSTISTLGVACNVLALKGTNAQYRARTLSGLHMIFGVGSLLAPGILGFFLNRGISWPNTLLPFAAGVLFLAFELRRLPEEPPTQSQTTTLARPTFAQWLIISCFGVYVCCEVMLSMWLTPYLVEHRHLSVASAAPYVSGFFLMMALSRLVCVLFLRPRHETLVLVGCLFVSGLAFTMGHAGWLPGFALAGVMGPFFPLFMARISRAFESQLTRLTIWSLATVQGSLALSHFVVGAFTDAVGIQNSYQAPFFLGALTLLLFSLYVREERGLLYSLRSKK